MHLSLDIYVTMTHHSVKLAVSFRLYFSLVGTSLEQINDDDNTKVQGWQQAVSLSYSAVRSSKQKLATYRDELAKKVKKVRLAMLSSHRPYLVRRVCVWIKITCDDLLLIQYRVLQSSVSLCVKYPHVMSDKTFCHVEIMKTRVGTLPFVANSATTSRFPCKSREKSVGTRE